MSLPIKTLPIAEQWDCTACGLCCRGHVVPLNDDDLQKLRDQHWEDDPEFELVDTVVKQGLLSKRYQLAQRDDGRCVFLGDDGRCRIHAKYGLEAKPLICQMYPLQLVPLGKRAVLTLRRSCPTAVVDEGRKLGEHLRTAKRLAAQGKLLDKPFRPPKITPKYRASWDVALQVAGAIEQLLTDERYPLVRRLVHGLRMCSLLEKARLKHLDEGGFRELLGVLTDACPEEAADVFRERQKPSGSASVLFRQAAGEYVRLHSKYEVRETWRERWRLTRAAVALARGSGDVPRLHDFMPETTFAALEEPLGHVEEAVQQPFVRYFEVNAASKQYAVAVRPGWSLVEAFRAIALAYPAALWVLRWCATGREPTREDSIEMVTIMDRGQGHAPLTGSHHRSRLRTLTKLDELERLVAWYAR